MTLVTRRAVIGTGGALVAALSLPPWLARADEPVEIGMMGNANGSEVWFDPIGIRLNVGQTIRWTNRDRGNSHTATAYHPDNAGRPYRIPAAAAPWNSGYLLPDGSFLLTLTVAGVYDYCCVPHEHAGMVGRIIVGSPEPAGWPAGQDAGAGVPEAALAAFPAIGDIISKGMVRRA